MKRILCLMMVCIATSAVANGASLSDDDLLRIRFDQKLQAQVSPALVFQDETGKSVQLGDYFGKKPIILIPGYYGCPMLCTLVLNGAIDSFRRLKQDVGDGFDVVFVSIDPSETPALASAKKTNYLRQYGRGRPDGWHFLVGSQASINALTDEIGFRFAYDAGAKQFAHPSGFVVLTPDGQVTRYFTGVTFAAKDLDAALHDASAGRVGAPEEQTFLLCFHYAPARGKYGRLVMTIVRAGGIATILTVAGLIFVPRRRRPPQKPG